MDGYEWKEEMKEIRMATQKYKYHKPIENKVKQILNVPLWNKRDCNNVWSEAFRNLNPNGVMSN